MSAKHFVIELGGGPASFRRTLEALDLAAGLAAFDHRVELVLRTAAVARLNSARAEAEVSERLAAVAEAGVGPAVTEAAGAPDHLGDLALATDDPEPIRARADAVLVF